MCRTMKCLAWAILALVGFQHDAALAQGKTWTTDVDFASGDGRNVTIGGGSLGLSATPRVFPHVWIANTKRHYVLKIDVSDPTDPRPIAGYRAGPAGETQWPSAFAVDGDGNCWVSNFTGEFFKGSATQIAAEEGVDRNSNGVIDTSFDTNSNGIIEESEILPWGQDEMVLRRYVLPQEDVVWQNPLEPVNGRRPHAIAIGPDGDLFVGKYFQAYEENTNPPRTPTVNEIFRFSPTIHAPPNEAPLEVTANAAWNLLVRQPGAFEFAFSCTGKLVISRFSNHATVLDPSNGNQVQVPFGDLRNVFSTAVMDVHGKAWMGGFLVLAINPDDFSGFVASHFLGDRRSTGPLAVSSSAVWVASNDGKIVKLDLNGVYQGELHSGGIDTATLGMVGDQWLCALTRGDGTSAPAVVTPRLTMIRTDGSSSHTLNLPKIDSHAFSPYSQNEGFRGMGGGDFTGFARQLAVQRTGQWTSRYDSGKLNTLWTRLSWVATTPGGSDLKVKVRAADTIAALDIAPFIEAMNGASLGELRGQYFDVRLCLSTPACGQATVVIDSIQVENDALPLSIACPGDISVGNDPGACEAAVTLCPATTEGGAQPVTIAGTRSDSRPLADPYPVGVTTITWTATDARSNSASCVQTITVNDVEPPVITGPPNLDVGNDPGRCDASVAVGTATATDNCAGVAVTGVRGDGLALGDPYPVGVTVITWTATDAAGHQAACAQTVTVRDVEAPSLQLPANMTVYQDSAHGATVTYTVTASDYCGAATVNCTPPSGSVFPLGTTTVTCTATDAAGNSATGSFMVTVVVPPRTAGDKVTGGGSILVPGGEATFGMVEMTNVQGDPKGNFTYQDHATGRMVKSLQITSLVVSGTRATIFLRVSIDGAGEYQARLIVEDLAEPGGGVDRFDLQLSNGYSAAGVVLAGGNIQIH